MFQILSRGYFDKKYSSEAYAVLKKYEQSIEDDSVQVEVDAADLLSWAQSFCNIDSNRNQTIDHDEFRDYVQKNYKSATKKEVLALAMKHFKAAVKEHDHDHDEEVGLDFKHFVKMMQELKKGAEDPSINEADYKFYTFLKKTNAKKELDVDSSVKNAKIIERAAG
jgi:hypothetical protein